MFLKCHPRVKDGKEHRYWSVVENRRGGRGKFVQRQVLYLGEINDSQRESWCRTIEVFDEQRERTLPLALFPADRQLPNFAAGFGVQVRLKEMELHRPRQWGACWLACHLYEQLGLDEFWAERLGRSCFEIPMPGRRRNCPFKRSRPPRIFRSFRSFEDAIEKIDQDRKSVV